MKTKSMVFLLAAIAAHADVIVTVNTAGLTGPGTFALGFQFIDGGVLGNNTATMSSFLLGGGSAGAVQTSNGASGGIGSTVTMNNSIFFGEFTQLFTPGTTLSFQLGLTNNFDGLTPDLLALVLFHNGVQVPTDDPGGALFYVELTGSPHVYQAFTSSTGIGGFNIPAPTVGAVGGGGPPSVPEPSTYALLVVAGAGLVFRRLRK